MKFCYFLLLGIAISLNLYCNNPAEKIKVRIHLSCDDITKEKIDHIDQLVISTDVGYFTGKRFNSVFNKPEYKTFINIKSIEAGIFEIEGVLKKKYYLHLKTKLDNTYYDLSYFPLIDLSTINKASVEYRFKLNKAMFQ
jgi:hypothetical protein